MVSPPKLPTAEPAPSVFGFRVRSEETLRFLRSDGGAQTLEIVTGPESLAACPPPEVEPLASWILAGAAKEERGTLYRHDQAFEFWTTDAGAYRIHPERGYIEIPTGCDEIVREQRLWGVPAMLCYIHRGDFPLHAAAVEVDDGGVVLAAPSRYGKTTLALAFHRRGYRVLSEDLVCCRVGARTELLPGPAVLRIRPDIYDERPPQGTHVIAARPDRVFLGLDDDRKGSGDPVPIKAVVFLRESSDGVTIERAAHSVALADLWALNFRLQTREGRAQSFQRLVRLVDAVPVWNLFRPLRLASLEPAVDRIVRQCSG
jgi:hypothetical protein